MKVAELSGGNAESLGMWHRDTDKRSPPPNGVPSCALFSRRHLRICCYLKGEQNRKCRHRNSRAVTAHRLENMIHAMSVGRREKPKPQYAQFRSHILQPHLPQVIRPLDHLYSIPISIAPD